ncbi:MAG: glycoside hydrolase family 32 protein [Chloroflexota bacterium]
MPELYRPRYHFTPSQMWMNDPNGLVYYDGEYHLFYQYHPESAVWGPMHWGHAVSRDLINWQHLPIALYPDEHGMIFSGSAVIDWNNTAGFGEKTLVAIFTYNKDHIETQNLAYSTDKGRTWTKYAGNPIVPHPDHLHDIRDPKVFWHEDHWVMSLAAGNAILFYISSDLKHWEQSGSFGNGYGSTDGVWETPDLFKLPIDDGLETRWVLTVGVGNGAPAGGSGTQYFIGDFDGRNFVSENSKETILWADHGADYYAPQSWNDEPNGRRLMLGWMNNWQYANLVPTSGWRGSFSLIRELSLKQTENGIRLIHQPIPETRTLRGKHDHWQKETIQPGSNLLENINDKTLEIMAEFQITEAVECFGFRVRASQSEYTTIGYKPQDKTLFVDRTHSGQVDFKDGFASMHSAELLPINGTIRLHTFVDSSSVEVFANDGLVAFTECIFSAEKSHGLELFAKGGNVILTTLDIYHINPAIFQTKEN